MAKSAGNVFPAEFA